MRKVLLFCMLIHNLILPTYSGHVLRVWPFSVWPFRVWPLTMWPLRVWPRTVWPTYNEAVFVESR